MLERLNEIEKTFDDLTARLTDPAIVSDMEQFKSIAKKRAEIEELALKIKHYKSCLKELDDTQELLRETNEAEMREYLQQESSELKKTRDLLEEEIKFLLLPKDPNDERNIIVEVRAGAGGQEASLFATDLFRMYSRYAEKNGWKTEVLSTSLSDLGGYKEIVFEIKGRGAYSRLKYESGVHRVQRIPVTESGGRIHTSTATVAVLPEAEEVDVQVDVNDLRVDIFRSSGPGGQSVNTADSAVRVTHIPTGIVVSCQDERSQLQNRERAMRILRARLLKQAQETAEAELAAERKNQVGTGDRSERIRTYNFPQNRVTDHRIGMTLHRLESVLEGDFDELIDSLTASEKAEKLRTVES